MLFFQVKLQYLLLATSMFKDLDLINTGYRPAESWKALVSRKRTLFHPPRRLSSSSSPMDLSVGEEPKGNQQFELRTLKVLSPTVVQRDRLCAFILE
jgi:hypothetical protein